MRIVFRADASSTIGHGHVMRSLTLANELRGCEAEVLFVCREHDGNLCDFIEEHGFAVARLPVDQRPRADDEPDDSGHASWRGASWLDDAEQTNAAIEASGGKTAWLVVDHYAVDQRWESALRTAAQHIMVVDDLADRAHDCTLLLDQNYYAGLESRYDKLLPASTKRLLGPRYALLRPEFAEARGRSRRRDGTVRRALVFFGATDGSGATSKVLQAVETLDGRIHADVILGAAHAQTEHVVRRYSGCQFVTFHEPVSNMAALMAAADLFIGAGGSTTWERCCLGLPSITISVARNQDAIAAGCEQAGACLYLGRSEDATPGLIGQALQRVIANPDMLAGMSALAASLTDGMGSKRVVRTMQQLAGTTESA